MSRVTVVGAGVVGTNLLIGLAGAGHEVRLAARDPQSDKVAAAREATGVDVVALEDAPSDADIVILAVPHAAVVATMHALGDTGDVIVVDATNPVGVTLDPGVESTLQLLADAAPAARLVKAFNTIGAEAYVHPSLDAGPAFLPVAGDAADAEPIVALAADLGFDALVVGDRSTARLLENVAEFWIHLAFRAGLGREFGFVRSKRA